jgi:hypothetical protein
MKALTMIGRNILIAAAAILAIAACTNPTGGGGGGGGSSSGSTTDGDGTSGSGATTYSVTYESVGQSLEDDTSYAEGDKVIVLGAPSEIGLPASGTDTFVGWDTESGGTGTRYYAGDSFPMGTDHVRLYAQWTTAATYTVTYDANEASTGASLDAGTVPTDPNTYELNHTAAVQGNSGGLAITGYSFLRWNTAADGTGTAYAEGETITITGNVTLYAQWNAPLAEDSDPTATFNATVEATIASDSDNDFDPVAGEDGTYEYTGQGGGELFFWDLNATGTISLEVRNEDTKARDAIVEIRIPRADGTFAAPADGSLTFTLAGNADPATAPFVTIDFAIPQSDFTIFFEGGGREYTFRNFEVTL